MLKFSAADFTLLSYHLEQLQSDCLIDETDANAAAQLDRWRDHVRSIVVATKFYGDKLGLDAVVGQSERLENQSKSTNVLPLCYLLRDLEGTIVRELKKQTFLMLRFDLSEFETIQRTARNGMTSVKHAIS